MNILLLLVNYWLFLCCQVFGSIDSEQSVPRTAPIATPEHDSSLVDLMHDASNNNNNNQRSLL